MTNDAAVEKMRWQIRMDILSWLGSEAGAYASKKYSGDNLAMIRKQILAEPHLEGDDFILNYFSRVKMFGLDTEQGRQAMGKMITTCIDYLVHSVVLFGAMPEPGHPSGEIKPWVKE